MIHLSWKRQISADSGGSGSNLNCSCLVVCSLFFPKIFYRYISIYLIRETPKKFQDSTTSYERSFLSFSPHFETGIKNSKKIKKLENLRIVSLYVDKFPWKITNFLYGNYFKKVFSETSYHAWRFMAFKPNDQSYGHIHGIVYSNDLILCTMAHLGIPNNVS